LKRVMAAMLAQHGDVMGGRPGRGDMFGADDGTARVTEMVDEAELE